MATSSFFYPKLSTLPTYMERRSFVQSGVLWILSNSFLTPTDCKIRQVQDLGSIRQSTQTIDLFNREIEVATQNQILLLRIMKIAASKIAQVVALLGVLVFIAPLGSIWHLGNSVCYIISRTKDEREQKKLAQHASALTVDSVWTLFTSALVYDSLIAQTSILKSIGRQFQREWKLAPTNLKIIMAAIFLFPASVSCILAMSILSKNLCTTIFPSRKPIELKEHFGIVQQDGWLLNYHRTIDKELYTPSGPNQTVNGHFFDLFETCGHKMFLQAQHVVQTFHLECTETEIGEFSNNPKQFLKHLDMLISRNSFATQSTKSLFQQERDTFKKLLEQHQESLDLLRQEIPLVSISSNDTCASYFRYKKEEGSPISYEITNDRLKASPDKALESDDDNFEAYCFIPISEEEGNATHQPQRIDELTTREQRLLAKALRRFDREHRQAMNDPQDQANSEGSIDSDEEASEIFFIPRVSGSQTSKGQLDKKSDTNEEEFESSESDSS